MNKFTLAENKGRELFKLILDLIGILLLHPSLDLFDTIDYYYTNLKGEEVGVEIKKRDLKFLSYPTYFMEEGKYSALIKRLDLQEFKRVLYVNFFGEDIAYIYSLDSIRKGILQNLIKLSSVNCNKTTAIDLGKKLKQIIELPPSMGIRLEKKEDKWIIIKKN